MGFGIFIAIGLMISAGAMEWIGCIGNGTYPLAPSDHHDLPEYYK